jgi:hypothetical protein
MTAGLVIIGDYPLHKGRLQKNKTKNELEFSNWGLDPPSQLEKTYFTASSSAQKIQRIF